MPYRDRRRAYKLTIRHLGGSDNFCERTRSFKTREDAFTRAAELLAERIADFTRVAERQGRRYDPASIDAVVNGPDSDLVTGRILRHDGTEHDLMEILAAAQQAARQSLHNAGWTDQDIERGERAR
jgi:hypothetical protein